jgi:CRP/FNR family transcriptional activator FtrB
MRRAELKIIRKLPLFRDMDQRHFDRLMKDALLQWFPARTELIRERELPDYLHVVVDGMIELFATRGGQSATIDILQPVTAFIIAAVIRDELYLNGARTLTPARILLVQANTIRSIFSEDTVFARAVVNELASRYRAVIQVLKNDRIGTSTDRVLNWMAREDIRQHRKGSIHIPFDKRILASYLGMRPENLSRTFQALKRYGISVHGKTIIIRDRKLFRQQVRLPHH